MYHYVCLLKAALKRGNIHGIYRRAGAQRYHRRLACRLSGEYRRRYYAQDIPPEAVRRRGTPCGDHIIVARAHERAVRDLKQMIAVVERVYGAHRIVKMPVAVLKAEGIIAVEVAGGAEIRHHGYHCDIAAPALVAAHAVKHCALIADKIIGDLFDRKSAPTRHFRRLTVAVKIYAAALYRHERIAYVAGLRRLFAAFKRDLFAAIGEIILSRHGRHTSAAKHVGVPGGVDKHAAAVIFKPGFTVAYNAATMTALHVGINGIAVKKNVDPRIAHRLGELKREYIRRKNGAVALFGVFRRLAVPPFLMKIIIAVFYRLAQPLFGKSEYYLLAAPVAHGHKQIDKPQRGKSAENI